MHTTFKILFKLTPPLTRTHRSFKNVLTQRHRTSVSFGTRLLTNWSTFQITDQTTHIMFKFSLNSLGQIKTEFKQSPQHNKC